MSKTLKTVGKTDKATRNGSNQSYVKAANIVAITEQARPKKEKQFFKDSFGGCF